MYVVGNFKLQGKRRKGKERIAYSSRHHGQQEDGTPW
jgi:hypothetical protein